MHNFPFCHAELVSVDRLVYYELTEDVESALNREKQLKRWHRQWKINLIKEMNPEFKDLSENWQDAETSSA